MEDFKLKFVRQEDVALDKIDLNSRPYQRPIGDLYIGILIDYYKERGYDRAKPIVLNQKHQIVDGQHRAVAAEKFGMIKIPAIIYEFAGEQNEVQYYLDHNDWRHVPSNKNYWNARYYAGDPLAAVLYQLAEDPECHLHQEVGIQEHRIGFKFSISQALLLIMYALNLSHSWNRTTYNSKALTRLPNYKYEEIRTSINLPLQWIFDCFGKDKEVYPHPYKTLNFQAIVEIYHKLKMQHRIATDKGYVGSVSRFKRFKFTPDFVAADLWGKKHMLVNFYNRGAGRTKDKLRLD